MTMYIFLLSISFLIMCFVLAVMNKNLSQINKKVNELDIKIKTQQKILAELNYEIITTRRKLAQEEKEVERSVDHEWKTEP